MDKSASGILIAPDQSEGEPGGWINKSPSPETQRVRVGSPERRMMEAMLLLCGERGYVEVTVAEVIARSGASRNTFYKHFSDKEECFFRAYEEGIEELAARVLEPARAADTWRAGVRAGLGALVEVLDEQPVIARCLLVEAYPAGRRAMDKRAEVLRRFGEELDRVREQMERPDDLPMLASEIVTGGIESLLRMQLQSGDPPTAAELLPELVYFAVDPYLGESAAEEERELARAQVG